MVEESEPYRLILAPQAVEDLKEIWQSNAVAYGACWADEYLVFIQFGLESLTYSPHRGRRVQGQQGLLSLLIQKRPRKEGHIAVYEIAEDSRTVSVLHVFHTKMNWGWRPRSRS